tara:strand:+ start:204 stop:1157 length:954 start_codon:yes stop_codon:yes gene_type:complete
MDLSVVYMVCGILLASYSVIGNDSVQTLGTFIASNRSPWYYQWVWASSIFLAAAAYGLFVDDWDISHGRLDHIPVVTIEWYHLLGPLALVILTRFGFPVSTTFMVLSVFAVGFALEQMLVKSFMGYAVAAGAAYGLWWYISLFLNEHDSVPRWQKPYWRAAQWCTTGVLYFMWLSHDMANFVIFAPRGAALTAPWIVFICTTAILLMGFMFWEKGGKIQEIVLEKSNTRYVRSATIIDTLYAFILYFFKELNHIPMSTTWVFVGLLAGRELAVRHQHLPQHLNTVFPLIAKDFAKMMFGLAVSLAVVLGVHYFIIGN